MIDPEFLQTVSSAISILSRAEDTPGAGPAAVAIFDLDGTMARGHMIFDFPGHLFSEGLFSKKEHGAIRKLGADFGKGAVSYRHVAERLPAIFAMGIAGQKQSALAVQAEKFVEWRMDHVFPHAKGLVKLMRGTGRPAIAISGSPQDTVSALARRLGMDAAAGTRLEAKAGRYTGNVLHNFILEETKAAFFEELLEKLCLDIPGSFGFGDTEQDVSFLGRVGHPVAINPSAELRAQALSKGWRIFTTDEDVVLEVGKIAGN